MGADVVSIFAKRTSDDAPAVQTFRNGKPISPALAFVKALDQNAELCGVLEREAIMHEQRANDLRMALKRLRQG